MNILKAIKEDEEENIDCSDYELEKPESSLNSCASTDEESDSECSDDSCSRTNSRTCSLPPDLPKEDEYYLPDRNTESLDDWKHQPIMPEPLEFDEGASYRDLYQDADSNSEENDETENDSVCSETVKIPVPFLKRGEAILLPLSSAKQLLDLYHEGNDTDKSLVADCLREASYKDHTGHGDIETSNQTCDESSAILEEARKSRNLDGTKDYSRKNVERHTKARPLDKDDTDPELDHRCVAFHDFKCDLSSKKKAIGRQQFLNLDKDGYPEIITSKPRNLVKKRRQRSNEKQVVDSDAGRGAWQFARSTESSKNKRAEVEPDGKRLSSFKMKSASSSALSSMTDTDRFTKGSANSLLNLPQTDLILRKQAVSIVDRILGQKGCDTEKINQTRKRLFNAGKPQPLINLTKLPNKSSSQLLELTQQIQQSFHAARSMALKNSEKQLRREKENSQNGNKQNDNKQNIELVLPPPTPPHDRALRSLINNLRDKENQLKGMAKQLAILNSNYPPETESIVQARTSKSKPSLAAPKSPRFKTSRLQQSSKSRHCEKCQLSKKDSNTSHDLRPEMIQKRTFKFVPNVPNNIDALSWAMHQKSNPEQFWISHLRDSRPIRDPEMDSKTISKTGNQMKKKPRISQSQTSSVQFKDQLVKADADCDIQQTGFSVKARPPTRKLESSSLPNDELLEAQGMSQIKNKWTPVRHHDASESSCLLRDGHRINNEAVTPKTIERKNSKLVESNTRAPYSGVSVITKPNKRSSLVPAVSNQLFGSLLESPVSSGVSSSNIYSSPSMKSTPFRPSTKLFNDFVTASGHPSMNAFIPQPNNANLFYDPEPFKPRPQLPNQSQPLFTYDLREKHPFFESTTATTRAPTPSLDSAETGIGLAPTPALPLFMKSQYNPWRRNQFSH